MGYLDISADKSVSSRSKVSLDGLFISLSLLPLYNMHSDLIVAFSSSHVVIPSKPSLSLFSKDFDMQALICWTNADSFR